MKDWERIRASRHDLTDYVIHFTRYRMDPDPASGMRTQVSARSVLVEILRAGQIWPTFAARSNRSSSTLRATIKGPSPAVCLTEQPLWAVLLNKSAVTFPRYSGYGIAYHKWPLYGIGGKPVIYGPQGMLGERIGPGQPGYEEGKDVFRNGLPLDLQWLWVNYQPAVSGTADYPVDFTWEREWRCKPPFGYHGLPVSVWKNYYPPSTKGCVLVEKDGDVPIIWQELAVQSTFGEKWPDGVDRIISLETAKRQLDAGRAEFGRIETWPFGQP